MPERPFTDNEVRTLRGMMDEYEFARRRHLLASQRWRKGRILLVTIGAGTLLFLNLVTVVRLFLGH